MAGLGRRSHYRKHLTDSVLHEYPEPDAAKGEQIAKIYGTRGGNMFEVLLASSSSSSSSSQEGSSKQEQQSSSRDDDDDVKDKNITNGNKERNNGHPNEEIPNNNDKEQSEPQLAILPTKFRKLVWVKRGDYIIVECGDDPEDEAEERRKNGDVGGGVRYLIKHVLYAKQVKHLKEVGLWPNHDPLFREEEDNENGILLDEELKANAIRMLKEQQKKEGGEEFIDSGDEEEEGEYCDENDLYFVNMNRITALKIEDSDSESTSSEE